MITLRKATAEDIEKIWKMQIEAFRALLEKYQDYDLSPAAEGIDKIRARYEQPWTTYFFIEADGNDVGAIRVVDRKNGSRKRISPLWIMEEYRGKGYAQEAISAVICCQKTIFKFVNFIMFISISFI